MVTELGRVPLGDVKREEKEDMLLEAYLAGSLSSNPLTTAEEPHTPLRKINVVFFWGERVIQLGAPFPPLPNPS